MNRTDNILPLRPHHGLCLRFFRGKGYSKDFVAEMTKIHFLLSECPSQKIALVCRADSVCASCPNRIDSCCNTEQKVSGFDNLVLELCGLSENDIISWEEFSGLILNNIIKSSLLQTVCADCQWFEICKNL